MNDKVLHYSYKIQGRADCPANGGSPPIAEVNLGGHAPNMMKTNIAKAAGAAAACMGIAAFAIYLHYTVNLSVLPQPVLIFGPPVAMALLLWRLLASRLTALLVLGGLSLFTALYVSALVFHDAP